MKISLLPGLPISKCTGFTFNKRHCVDIRIKCGFIAQYETVFKNVLEKYLA